LRFPEFSGEWEKKKINSFTTVKAGATPSTLKPEYWNGNIRWMSSGELNNKRIYEVNGRISELGLQKTSTTVIPVGCVLIGLAGQGKTRGTAAINYVELCTNQSIASILPSAEIDTEFLYQNIESRYQELRDISSSDGGRGGLNLKIIGNLFVPVCSIKEQQKIAKFLSLLDKRIATQNKIIEQYKSLIKGLSEKLFAQVIRFKGFAEIWQKNSFGAVLVKNLTKNKNQNYSTVQSVSNKYGFVDQNEIFENRRVASINTSNYYVIDKGCFAYNPSRINIGSIAYKNDDKTSIISPLYISFRAKNNVLTDCFLWYWFTTADFKAQMNNLFEGSVRDTLSYESLTQMVISLPSIEEQCKISDFLFKISGKIETEECMLEQLEAQKSYLLSQMFI
jgi:type I restriction enzyme S subunit